MCSQCLSIPPLHMGRRFASQTLSSGAVHQLVIYALMCCIAESAVVVVTAPKIVSVLVHALQLPPEQLEMEMSSGRGDQ